METSGKDMFLNKLAEYAEKMIYISQLPPEEAEDALSEFMYVEMLYGLTHDSNIIVEGSHYSSAVYALLEMGVERGRSHTTQCKFFTMILAKYYPKHMDELFDAMVKQEKYEMCSELNKMKQTLCMA